MNYYEILGLNRNASNDDIKKSYRKLAMKYHPDRNKGDTVAEEQFKKVNKAYSILSDEKKKRDYDYSLDVQKNSPFSYQSRRSNAQNMQDFADIINEFYKKSQRQKDISGNFSNFRTQEENENIKRQSRQSYHYYSGREKKESPNSESLKKIPTKVMKLNFWESIFGTEKNYEFMFQKKKLKTHFTIPPGVDEKSEFFLDIKKYNIKKIIKFKINKDKYFIRKDLDLYVNIITPKKTKNILLSYWKKTYDIKLGDNLKEGTFLMLNGLGVRKGNNVGNLYLKIHFLPENYNSLPLSDKNFYKNKGCTMRVLNNHIQRNVNNHM